MEEIGDLKNKLQCQKCRRSYEQYTAWFRDCNHHTCYTCSGDASYQHTRCPVCYRSTTKAVNSLFLTDVFKTLESCASSILKSGEVEATLRDEIATLKEEKVLLETPPDYYKCIECDKLYPDQEMQLCVNCHELQFEDNEDVKKHALCSTCTLKKHVRRGHHTVDFFPYFSAYNFSSQSQKVHSNSAEFKSARDLLTDTCTRFNSLSTNVSENYELLTNMARKSKNTKNQVECFEKMEKFIDKSKSIHVEADADMKNHTIKLEEALTEIKEWYESRKGDCVDESEIIKLPNSDDSDRNDAEVDA